MDKIEKKYYSEEDQKFHIITRKRYSRYTDDNVHDCFQDFYQALDGDLDKACLLGYDFDDFDPTKCNLAKAKISAKTMQKIGTYSDKTFQQIRKNAEYAQMVRASSQQELVVVEQRMPEYAIDDLIICYISDLHLDYKLLDRYKDGINQDELKTYLRETVLRLKESIPRYSYYQDILIIGDVAYNPFVYKMFFKFYCEEIYNRTYVILGNHELWDEILHRKGRNVADAVEQYRQYFAQLSNNIVLLENQLIFPKGEILDEDQLLQMSDEELRKRFIKAGYAIFGGVGYAGKNQEANSLHRMYGHAPITREQEIELSKRVNELHARIARVAQDKQVIIATHMPIQDWLETETCPKWIYISGHTHRNFYIENEETKFYADNQIGYGNAIKGFKYIALSKKYNIFVDYPDGIYEISRNDYKSMYFGLGIRIEFNREYEKIFMLKRDGTYCFVLKRKGKEELQVLNGGMAKKSGNHSLQYYYDKLSDYAKAIRCFMSQYDEKLQEISKAVKRIGGNGTIHGCIVDIDFFNHLYVNPLDFSITPYFAHSIMDKYVFPNVMSLLHFGKKEMEANYKQYLIGAKASNIAMLCTENEENIVERPVHVTETDMYRVSRVIKSLQYTTQHNIVRVWNDNLINEDLFQGGKSIVENILAIR